MVERERFFPKLDDPRRLETFEMKHISLDEVPPAVTELLEARREDFFLGEDQPPFSEPFLIQHTDGTETYIVTAQRSQSKEYSRREVTYAVDVIRNQVAGYGEIWVDPELLDKPYVGRVHTTEEIGDEPMVRRGLMERRLSIMRHLTENKYNESLYSGELNDATRNYWERLVGAGLAEKVGDPYRPDEFKFKKLASSV